MVNIQSAWEISTEGDRGHGMAREMNVVEARIVRSREWHQRRGGRRAGVTVTGREEQLRGKIAFLFRLYLGEAQVVFAGW